MRGSSVSTCFTKPARDRTEPHLRQHTLIRHFVAEDATLLCKVTFPCTDPMGAIDLPTENTGCSRVITHTARTLRKMGFLLSSVDCSLLVLAPYVKENILQACAYLSILIISI